jgi:UDP-N-acetylmuramoyl-tripeptide--D-alanyl-D-alanine ligase
MLILLYTTAMLMIACILYVIGVGGYGLALVLIAIIPITLLIEAICVNLLGNTLLALKRRGTLRSANEKMARHPGQKIAILGSYGKTTAKELLAAVMSSEKELRFSEGNRNVLISHAQWINTAITGKENYVIFEFGEYKKGDIAQLAELTHPDYAIITGYAPNHLDSYKTEEALKDDLRSIQKYVDRTNIYASEQAAHALGMEEDFSQSRVRGRKIGNCKLSLEGMSFELTDSDGKVAIQTKLVGRHLVGIIAAVYVICLELGISQSAILNALAKIEPYPHRLKPRNLHGAWIIDDTYNGNLEGIRAGIALLKEVSAKRKIYVTPGLVEQGSKKVAVHEEIADLLVNSKIDEIVLMKNSATEIIADRLQEKSYVGKIVYVTDPVEYYQRLEYTIADGDIVLLQNDWTDNYT